MVRPAPSPEQLDEDRDMERLYGEAGWYRLEKEWQASIDSIRANALETITDENSLWRHRGRVEVLERLVRMRNDFLAEKADRETYAERDPDGPDYE